MDLFKHKYQFPVTVFSTCNDKEPNSIMDVKNSAFFTVINYSSYIFMDKGGNMWLSSSENLMFNETIHSVNSSKFLLDDGSIYYFTSKEEVIAKAFEYFEKYIIYNYGIKTIATRDQFSDNYQNKFTVVSQKFKLEIDCGMDDFLSYN